MELYLSPIQGIQNVGKFGNRVKFQSDKLQDIFFYYNSLAAFKKGMNRKVYVNDMGFIEYFD